MESFDYAAIDTSGKRLSGSIMATTPREARDILSARALTPISLAPAKTKDKLRHFSLERHPNHKELTQATRQLAILIDAATPVEDALKVTALQFEHVARRRSPMRQILLAARARVMEGERLSNALKAHPKTFSPLYMAMIASGESSGRLAAVMERLAIDLEAALRIRRKILAATIYPMVLSAVALIVTCILMIAVVPKVVEQFDTFGQDLPGLTKFVIALSDGLKRYGIVLALFVISGLIGFRLSLRLPKIKRKWHSFILALVFIGRLNRNLNAARFARTISGLIESGTASLNALEISRHTLRNQIMHDAVGDAMIKIREGIPISRALQQTKVFPPLVTQMVAGGEASGDIGKMFSKSADYLEDEFESTTAVFLSLLEPLIIILLSLVVLLIIGAIFLPILRLNTLAF